MQIIICSGFNNTTRPLRGKEFGIERPISKEWMKFRHNIWENYTWESLMNQSDKDWVYVIKCSPKRNVLAKRLFGNIDERIEITFSEEEERKILRRYNEVLLIRIDSDDMYRFDAISEYRKAANSSVQEFFLCKHGYIHEQKPGGELAKYDPKHSSPFHARRINGQTHEKCGIGMQHRKIGRGFHFSMPSNLFVVGVNGQNTSSRMQIKTGDIEYKRWGEILIKFGAKYKGTQWRDK